MATSTTGLLDRLKTAAARVGTQGVRVVIDALISAADEVDRLQELWPKQRRVTRVKQPRSAEQQAASEPDLYRPMADRPLRARPERAPRPQRVPPVEVQATAELVLEEARAVQERLKKARPARRPLKVAGLETEEAEATPKRRRTSGRKTVPSATAPKSAQAQQGGFKAKRGQKHRH